MSLPSNQPKDSLEVIIFGGRRGETKHILIRYVLFFLSFFFLFCSFWAIESTILLSKFVCGSEISVCDTGMTRVVVQTQIIVACMQIADLKGITANSVLCTNNFHKGKYSLHFKYMTFRPS